MEEEGMASDELKSVKWEELDYAMLSTDQLLKWENEFAKFFLTKTKAELYGESMKRDVMLFPCNTMEDCLEDEQLAARDFWVKVEHPELADTITYPGAPLKLNEAPWQVWRRPPLIGEHNDEIYGNELGFSRQALDHLKELNVI
jgi:crotonobetainyl-CoA:carnitine CoA-transferase CaiB-like acyl-CoA transferase